MQIACKVFFFFLSSTYRGFRNNEDSPSRELRSLMGAKSGSWSGGKGTSAEVPAVTSSSSGHNGFNMVSVWPPGPSSPVPVGCGGIVGPSEKSGYLDYQKKEKTKIPSTRINGHI